jgi:hypothetical protein
VFGLTVAKTYKEIHPNVNIAILESAGSLGGTWAKHRLYPGLRSNNLLGTYESPDYPMDTEQFHVEPGQFIPGTILHKYWEQYAKNFRVYELIRFNTKAVKVEEYENDGWLVYTDQNGQQGNLATAKLIMATGLTSDPFLPQLNGAETFNVPLFHSKYFLQHADTLNVCKSIAVLGGAKSAWDVAYEYATKGIHVDMIIRESGKGPVWMAPPYVTPFKKWIEALVFTRFLTWLSPCIWGACDGFGWIRSLLHNTAIGRGIVDTFWKILSDDVITLNKFRKHPETDKLKPWSSAMWVGAGLSIVNYPTDFFELVKKGMIRVHHADIERLSQRSIHLSTGEAITADALICATGWYPAPAVEFAPEGMEKKLGLPYCSDEVDPVEEKADLEILEQFPRLREQPNIYAKSKRPFEPPPPGAEGVPNHSYKLYRFLVPPAYVRKRNIVFPGTLLCLTTPLVAQVQALWIVAYFDGGLAITKSNEEIAWETELWSRFGKWRTPAGARGMYPDIAFDTLPYIDALMRDLGLKYRRKGGIISECTEPYMPVDYKSLSKEWAESQMLHKNEVEPKKQK